MTQSGKAGRNQSKEDNKRIEQRQRIIDNMTTLTLTLTHSCESYDNLITLNL
jgi:hypothetical protein